MAKNLTLKQLEFIQKYFEFGNATESVMQVYNVKRRVIAAVMAKQLKRKPHVMTVIDEVAKELYGIDSEW